MSRRIAAPNKVTLTETQSTARQGGKLIYTSWQGRRAALLIQDNRLKAAQFFPQVQSKIGAVYLCKVKNVIKNLDAYFVEIGGAEREICFLSRKDAACPFLLNRSYDGRILEGDEFPVQVVKDAQKNKQASVTTRISLSNDYFALNAGDVRVGYSTKLSEAERKRLRQQIQNLQPLQNTALQIPLPHEPAAGEEKYLPVGMVVRTRAAGFVDSEEDGDALERINELALSFQELAERWQELFRAALHRTCYSCILEAPSPWKAALEQLVYPYEYEEILTDDERLYRQLQESSGLPPGKEIRYYDEMQSAQLPLSQLYGLQGKIEEALSRRVWLKSGGYLVIDSTEALTVIDVNSGKYEARKDVQESYFRINREAAAEIAIQLRLRNLSGIIVVDFINMKEHKCREELLRKLRLLLMVHCHKTTVVDMTPLGLVEITRKKESKPLREQLES